MDFLGVRTGTTPIEIRGLSARGVEIEWVDADNISLAIGFVGVAVGVTSRSLAASRCFVNSFAVTPTYLEALDPSVNITERSVVVGALESGRVGVGFFVSFERGTKRPDKVAHSKY